MMRHPFDRILRLAPMLAAALTLTCGVPPVGPTVDGTADSPGFRFTRVRTGAIAVDAYSSPSASWNDGDLDLFVPDTGAIVTVVATIEGAPRSQHRFVGSRTSWRSSGSLTQHVGWAGAGQVDRIEVAWPSGRVQTVDGPLATDRIVVIGEGRTTVP